MGKQYASKGFIVNVHIALPILQKHRLLHVCDNGSGLSYPLIRTLGGLFCNFLLRFQNEPQRRGRKR